MTQGTPAVNSLDRKNTNSDALAALLSSSAPCFNITLCIYCVVTISMHRCMSVFDTIEKKELV